MVSTRKRSYSSSGNESGYGSEVAEPQLKRSKLAVPKSGKRKRNVSNITNNDEIDNVGLISKRPKIDKSKNENEISTISTSATTTTTTSPNSTSTSSATTETPIITEITTTTSSSSSSSSTTTTSATIINENLYNCKKNIRKNLLEDFNYLLPEPFSTRCCLENERVYVECPKACDKYGCKNRFISNKSELTEKEIEIFQTEEKGYGLKAKVEIAKGTYIGNYCGEVIDEQEKKRRFKKNKKSGSNAFYMMELENYYIDAQYFGSKMRYINHSCDPNCQTQVYAASDGLPNVCIFAIKNIPAGEELSFHYSPDSNHKIEQEFKCFCAAENCEGTFFA